MNTESEFNLGKIVKYLDNEGDDYHLNIRSVDIDEWMLEITFPTYIMMSVNRLKEIEQFVNVTYIRFDYDSKKGVTLECFKKQK